MNISELKTVIAALPDDAPVLVRDGNNKWREVFGAESETALRDGTVRPDYTQDIYVGPVGENTPYGVRVVALCLD